MIITYKMLNVFIRTVDVFTFSVQTTVFVSILSVTVTAHATFRSSHHVVDWIQCCYVIVFKTLRSCAL